MEFSVEEAIFILQSPKRLIKPLDWVSLPNNQHKNPLRQIETRVSVDGAIKRSIFFRARLYPAYPQTMTFQLEVDHLDNRSHIVLYRLDVCPLSQHTNNIDETRKLSGITFRMGETHEHIVTDNLTLDSSRILSSSDKYARKIEHPPENFSLSVNYICDRINIENGEDLPFPIDQGLLL